MMHDTPHPNPCPPYPGLDPDLLRLANVSGRHHDWVVLAETLKEQALTYPVDVATMRDACIETTPSGGVYPVTVLTGIIRRLFAWHRTLHKDNEALRISLAGREQAVRRQHESMDRLLCELRPLRELNHSLRTSLESAEANNSKMAQDNEALRLRAEAAEARLKHEQANTEAGARLCNEAFAVLTTKVGTLEAKLAETEKARDKVLSLLENARTDREAQAKRIEMLSNLRDVLSSQRDEAITTREAALRQRDARIKQAEELQAELAEARRRGDAALDDLAGVVRQRNERTEEREMLRERVVELAAELAEARRRGDAALRQVQELRTTQQGTHRPPSVRVTVYLIEEDDGLPD